MIPNKYFNILKQFSGNYTLELHGRGLIKKVPLSPKAIALSLGDLEQQGILKSRMQGNMKYFRLNLENTEIRDILNAVELLQKINFFLQHRTLAHIFHNDERIVGIFGSYAKGTQRKKSDLDLFIIGSSKDDYGKEGKTYDLDISAKFFTEKEFITLCKQKNPLVMEIIENHILIFGIERFIFIVWRYYYGFN